MGKGLGTASEVRDVNVFLKARELGLTLIISRNDKFDYQRFIYLRFLVHMVVRVQRFYARILGTVCLYAQFLSSVWLCK